MNVLKKLDHSSRLLILISIVGIVLALVGFLFLKKQSAEDADGKDLVAKVTMYQNDTRVKRSDNIHWYPVNQTTDCFEDDLIFTGGESTATIEFPTGDKVTLHPNSLISLSRNLISLESGAIEVDLSSDTPIQLESFGEKFTLKQKSKVRVIQSEKAQKIIPLNEVAKTIKVKEAVKKYIESDDLNITAPQVGKLLPHLENYIVQLKWNTSLQDKNAEVSFSEASSKTPFLTLNATSNSLDVPLKNFPTGIIHWKVKAANGATDESSFNLTKDLGIKLNYPSPKDTLPFSAEGYSAFTADWSAPLEFSQRIQVATDSSFTKVILDEAAHAGQKNMTIKKEGLYFWRVGYEFQNNLTHWSEASEFSVKGDTVIAPIEIKMASVFDFSLNKTYKAEVKDPNSCDTYQFIVLKNQEIVADVSSPTPAHTFQKMENGLYTLKVLGSLKGKAVVEASADFEVKTSGPLQAPKIIKKNRKLFVKVMEGIFNLIIPSSMASEAIAPLSWEGPEGATYEVEIAKTPGAKALVKQQLQQTTIDFKVPKPGTYYWRVRYKEGDRWSPFSEYDEIKAEDKILLIKSPLMVSPAQDAKAKLENEKGDVTFTWNTPYPDFEYSLEIYSSPTGQPLKVIPVTGNSKTLKFRDKPSTFYWRIVAKSTYGNITRDETKYRFSIASTQPAPEVTKSKFGKIGDIIVTGLVSQTSMSYDQKIDDSTIPGIDKDISLSGQTFWLNAEYWPVFGKGKHGMSLGMDYATLSSGSSKYTETELIVEYARMFKKDERNTHKGFVGIHSSQVDLRIDSSTQSNYSVSYLSARYLFNRVLNDKWSLDLNSEILVLMQADLAAPSLRLRPMAQYKLRKNLWLNGFLGFERNVAKPKYDESGVRGNLTINTQNIHYGLGLTWLH